MSQERIIWEKKEEGYKNEQPKPVSEVPEIIENQFAKREEQVLEKLKNHIEETIEKIAEIKEILLLGTGTMNQSQKDAWEGNLKTLESNLEKMKIKFENRDASGLPDMYPPSDN